MSNLNDILTGGSKDVLLQIGHSISLISNLASLQFWHILSNFSCRSAEGITGNVPFSFLVDGLLKFFISG